MATESETRTLKGGQLLNLVRSPGEKWRINSLDHYGAPDNFGETVSGPKGVMRTVVGVLTRCDLPEEWAKMRFDSVDEAVAFVEGEIAALAV